MYLPVQQMNVPAVSSFTRAGDPYALRSSR